MNICWRTLAARDTRVYKKGAKIPAGTDLNYLLKGCVRLTAITRDGVEKIIWYLKDNTIFNETPVFTQASLATVPLPPAVASLSSRARETSLAPVFANYCTHDSLVGRIPFETAVAAGRANPELILNLCCSFGLKVSLLACKMTNEQIASTRQRVFGYLATRLKNTEEAGVIQLDSNFQDLASYLAVHRVSLYRTLDAAREQGLLDYSARGKSSAFSTRRPFSGKWSATDASASEENRQQGPGASEERSETGQQG